MPAAPADRRRVLERIAERFEHGREYEEREVNVLLSQVDNDFAMLRRYLVDERILDREKGRYRLRRSSLPRVPRPPAPPYAGEGPHALWHVSEDPSIQRFEPRPSTSIGSSRMEDGSTSPTPAADTTEPLVWAIDTRHLPLFWFPRDCPRGTFWAAHGTSDADVDRFLDGDRSRRVHAIESDWLERMRAARVFAYRLPGATFRPHFTVGGYWVSTEAVAALERVELGDLLARHAAAAIELRIVPSIWPLWDRVVASTLEFSGSRLRNARPRDIGVL